MRWRLGVLFLFVAGPAFAQGPTGAITGTIRYLGEIPASKRIMTTDGNVIVHNDVVVSPSSKGLRHVIILVDWQEKVPADAKAKPVVIDQRDMLFLPRVVTVQEGRAVRFENGDNCNHAVDATSVLRENTFNVTTPMGQPYEHKFKAQKNPIPIGCAIHSWMRAWVIVAPHPFHAVTDGDGKFTIESVPAGKRTLQFIHPDTNYRETREVAVAAGKTSAVTIEWKSLKN